MKSPYGDHLWLDIRHLGEHHITTKLREIYDICTHFLGVNPIHQLIPVRPTQHYSMGGVRADKDGHAYGLKGLFAAGEAACWDLHGFNRLGGNSLAETVVSGRYIGNKMVRVPQRVPKACSRPNPSTTPASSSPRPSTTSFPVVTARKTVSISATPCRTS